MARVAITGAFGNVGRSAVAAHLQAGDELTLLEADTPRNRALSRRLLPRWSKLGACRLLFGDVRNPATAQAAVAGQDAVVHLAALIPPAADRSPTLARSINVGGTANLLAACAAESRPPRFVLASSISIYGDRVEDYWISSGDQLAPNDDDEYGKTKVDAEAAVRASGLPFVILRLSAIMWRKKLDPDPLLFRMPLATKLEICHTEDAGRAFAAAVHEEAVLGRTFDIGGGQSCRTTYRDFLDRMFRLIGLGGLGPVPESAFAKRGFHCGWLVDSDEAERVLRFRAKGLEDYYAEVAEEARFIRAATTLVAPIVRARLLAASPFFRGARSAMRPA